MRKTLLSLSLILTGFFAIGQEASIESKSATNYWDLNVPKANIDEDPCEWTVTVHDPDYFGDEVSWELRGSDGDILLSGGFYSGGGYFDEQTISAKGPIEFFISALGDTNDNKPAYSIANGNGIILTGVMTGGTEGTFDNLNCSDSEWKEDYNCEEQSMTTDEIEGAFQIGGYDLHNRLALDIPVNDEGFTLYGLSINFFVSFGPDVDFDFVLYEDNSGKPGEQILQTSSQILEFELLGNQFGMELYEFELVFDEEMELNPNNRYWLELETEEGAWQTIDYNPIGKGIAYKNDFTEDEWIVDPTSEFIYSLICNEDLSINTIDSINFSFYPNPVNHTLYLQLDKSIESVFFYDLTGKKILELNADQLESNSIDVSSFVNGLYFMNTVFDNGQEKTFKVIKK